MPELLIDRVVSEELASTSLGGKTLDQAGFSASLADSPIAFPLDRAFAALGKPIPTDAGLYTGFRLWLVPHRVAILRRTGRAEPTSVGIEVEYLNGEQTCSVVSLLPAPKFVEHGSIWIKGSMSATGEVDTEVAPPIPEALPLTLGDLEFRASAGAEVSFRFRASVVTPVLSAVGIGSRRCEWKFDRDREALFGRDIPAWSVLALPKRQKTLRYRVRYSVTLRTLYFETRHESEWQEIRCELPDGVPGPAVARPGGEHQGGTKPSEATSPRSLRGFAAYASSTRSVQQFLDERREENARGSREVEGDLHG